MASIRYSSEKPVLLTTSREDFAKKVRVQLLKEKLPAPAAPQHKAVVPRGTPEGRAVSIPRGTPEGRAVSVPQHKAVALASGAAIASLTTQISPKTSYLSTITITGTAAVTDAYNVVLASLTGAATLNIPAAQDVLAGFFYIVSRLDGVDADLAIEPASGTIDGESAFAVPASTTVQILASPSSNSWQVYATSGSTVYPPTPSGTNVAYGEDALLNNTTGTDNSAFGAEAMLGNMTGSGNVAIGYEAMYGPETSSQSVAIGEGAMAVNTGTSNVGIGFGAMAGAGSSEYNVAVGAYAANGNTTGSNNVMIGYSAAMANLIGSNDVVVGYEAVFNGQAGTDNVIIGASAAPAYGATATGNNVIIGANAAANATTATSCTIIGEAAGAGLTIGPNVIAIGQNVGPGANVSNSIYVGAQPLITTATNNQVIIGNSSITAAICAVAWTQSSDADRKKKIEDQPLGLSFIKRLRPRTYLLKSEADEAPTSSGFIAQELDAALKEENAAPQSWLTNSGEQYGWLFSPTQLISPLVKAIQELNAKVEALTREAANK